MDVRRGGSLSCFRRLATAERLAALCVGRRLEQHCIAEVVWPVILRDPPLEFCLRRPCMRAQFWSCSGRLEIPSRHTFRGIPVLCHAFIPGLRNIGGIPALHGAPSARGHGTSHLSGLFWPMHGPCTSGHDVASAVPCPFRAVRAHSNINTLAGVATFAVWSSATVFITTCRTCGPTTKHHTIESAKLVSMEIVSSRVDPGAPQTSA